MCIVRWYTTRALFTWSVLVHNVIVVNPYRPISAGCGALPTVAVDVESARKVPHLALGHLGYDASDEVGQLSEVQVAAAVGVELVEQILQPRPLRLEVPVDRDWPR